MLVPTCTNFVALGMMFSHFWASDPPAIYKTKIKNSPYSVCWLWIINEIGDIKSLIQYLVYTKCSLIVPTLIVYIYQNLNSSKLWVSTIFFPPSAHFNFLVLPNKSLYLFKLVLKSGTKLATIKKINFFRILNQTELLLK